MNNLTINELEKLFKLIVEKLKKDNIKNISIDFDEYWFITSDEWNNLNETPQPGVGSLAEDVEYLKKALNQNEIFTYSDLDRMSSILKAISEKEAPIN
jgi:hypothetical protein